MTLYYNKGSKLVDGKLANKILDKETSESCAKEVDSSQTDNKVYYIKTYNNSFVDPFNVDLNRRTKNIFKWVRVKKEVFDLYLRFLRTGSRQALHHAERKF